MSLLSSALVILIVMIIRVALIKCGKCSLSKSESNVREQSWVQLILSISISRPSLFDAFLTQCHLHQQSIGQNKQRLHLCKSIHHNHSKDKNKQTTTITTTTTSTIKPQKQQHTEWYHPYHHLHHYHHQSWSNVPKCNVTTNDIKTTAMIKPTQVRSSDEVEHFGRQQRCPWLPSSSCSPPWSTPEFVFWIKGNFLHFKIAL